MERCAICGKESDELVPAGPAGESICLECEDEMIVDLVDEEGDIVG